MKRRTFLQTAAISAGGVLISPAHYPTSNLHSGNINLGEYPFIWGAQYYRAPTPEREIWEADFLKMKEMGFNHVKFWVQWRWSHVRENEFYFDDLKELLTMAETHGLKVTFNTIFDVSPTWLFDKYPGAKQVMNNGTVIEPIVVGHRQIGGHPGPCYNHPGVLEERQKFLKEAVSQLKNYKAIEMWDIWNEPELSFPQRSPIDIDKLACYCGHCESNFKAYLKEKYGSIGELNQKWGRNYLDWDMVELPRTPDTFLDFVDWREFHGHIMTQEAKWRIELVKSLDPKRIAYLHVVPQRGLFNAVTTCSDDYKLSEMCDVFAATMTSGPLSTPEIVSKARGKICYNVESHIKHGRTGKYPRIINLDGLLQDFVPQIGLGVKGFLFWQFRPEVLGHESPAWGLVNLDGTDKEITKAARQFWETLKPHALALMDCLPAGPEIGIWRGRKNEIFQYCIHKSLKPMHNNIDGYAETLYWNNYAFRFISGGMLENGELDKLKILIMPSAYYLTKAEADSLINWVKQGGILLAEAHLGAYNGTDGRHSRSVPGCGIARAFGIKELRTTDPSYLGTSEIIKSMADGPESNSGLLDLLRNGDGEYFPIYSTDGNVIVGASRYAELSAGNFKVEGYVEKGKPCAVSGPVGKGHVYYYGTRLGMGAKAGSTGLTKIIDQVANKAGVGKILGARPGSTDKVRIDALRDSAGNINYITVQNRSGEGQTVTVNGKGKYTGLFSGRGFTLNGEGALKVGSGMTDIFVRHA